MAIQVRDLSKNYGPVEAVRDVSFEVRAGEILGLLGPNGAGKTTILECLLGLRQPDRGSFRIGEIDAFADSRAACRLIGAQLQSSALQDKITVREAVTLIAAFHENPVEADELLAQFELTAKASTRFDALSGGQKQRLLLALAFVHRPAILLLDEPTVGLDPAARRELHRLIAAQRDAGRAVLLSTHYLDEAAQLCDRVAILDQGRIIACAAPHSLATRAQALPRIRVRTARRLEVSTRTDDLGTIQETTDRGTKALLPSMGATLSTQTVVDGEWVTTVQARDVGATAAALIQAIERTGNSLRDLQIERPTLEDVFLELTGKPWSADESEASR